MRVVKSSNIAAFLLLAIAPFGLAQETAPSSDRLDEFSFVLNSLLFLNSGVLVLFMLCGFLLLHVGNTALGSRNTISLQHVVGLAICLATHFLVGYSLQFPSEWVLDGVVGAAWGPVGTDSSLDVGYASSADVFFSFGFSLVYVAAILASIGGRVRLIPLFIAMSVFAAFVFPVGVSWEWGGGWLDELGFTDFSGATLVHVAAGGAAVGTAMALRGGSGNRNDIPNRASTGSAWISSVGTLLVVIGFVGFNGGSQLAVGSFDDVDAVSKIVLNSMLAGAGGTLVALIASTAKSGRPNIRIVLGGTLGGVVLISAEPLSPDPIFALGMGGIAGLLVSVIGLSPLSKTLGTTVYAVPVHLGCGALGALFASVSVSSDATWQVQATGVASVFAFNYLVALITFTMLRISMKVAVSPADEEYGLDAEQVG